MGDDAVVGELDPERLERLLGTAHGVDRRNLERQVVQTGQAGGEGTLALLPQGDAHGTVLAQKGELPVGVRAGQDVEVEQRRVKLDRPVQVRHVQRDVARLESRVTHGDLQVGTCPPPFYLGG